ncbi:MAG: hypothetical protein VW270_11450 [Candidatus Poseidoniales archaeon]
MKQKLKLLAEKFTESWSACMICMVQGDLTVISLQHAYTASKTGILAGVAVVVASYLPWRNPWIGVFLTGLFTMLADIIVHATHFGGQFTEAMVTGLTAMAIAIVYDKVKGGNNAT